MIPVIINHVSNARQTYRDIIHIPAARIEKIILTQLTQLSLAHLGKRGFSQNYNYSQSCRNVTKKSCYGDNKGKVADQKRSAAFLFLFIQKVLVWPENTGKVPVGMHDIATSGMYNIDRFRDEKWIRQDLGKALVTKAQIDTLLSYWAEW